MLNVPQDWKPLSAADLLSRFGKTTWHEEPLGWIHQDGRHFVVLRDQAEGDDIWWSLFRSESGEYAELARNYGDEIWNHENEDLEVRWSGIFPVEWVDSFVNRTCEWLRISVSELFENFGSTVETEQPQAWRHREGEHYLVLVGETSDEGRETFSWSIVREDKEGYEEIAEYYPGVEDEDEDDEDEESSSGDVPLIPRLPLPEPEERWWEEPPFDWADEVVMADIETRGT